MRIASGIWPFEHKILRILMNKTDELRTARIESLVTPAELAQRLSTQFDLGEQRDAEAVIAARLEELALLRLVLRA